SPSLTISSHPLSTLLLSFFYHSYAHHRHLPSFPTRRSSDLYPNKLTCGTSHDGTIDSRGGACNCGGGRRLARQRGRSLARQARRDRKSTRLNSSHVAISYAVFCLKKKNRTVKSCRFARRIAA